MAAELPVMRESGMLPVQLAAAFQLPLTAAAQVVSCASTPVFRAPRASEKTVIARVWLMALSPARGRAGGLSSPDGNVQGEVTGARMTHRGESRCGGKA